MPSEPFDGLYPDEPDAKERAAIEHRWSECELCGPMVICGKCGNNCCNGGYGEIDGKPCDACPSAYDMQDREYRDHITPAPDA